MANLSGIWNYAGRTTYDPGSLSTEDPEIQKLIDQGIITKEVSTPAIHVTNESGTTDLPDLYSYNIDYSKLPKTVFGGSALDVRQEGGPFKTINPKLVLNDPNYGLITPTWNQIDPGNQHDIYDMIGPVFSGILGTAIGIPWYLKAGLSAAKYLGDDKDTTLETYKAGVSSLMSSNSPASAENDVGLADLFSFLSSSEDSTVGAGTSSLAPTESKSALSSTEQPQQKQEDKLPIEEDVSSLYSELQRDTEKQRTLYALLSGSQSA